MKASEAKALTNKNEKWMVIRRSLDKSIKQSAKNGDSSIVQFFYDDHDTKKVVESLRADGFKCTVREDYDPRDNESSYLYKVSW